MNETQKGWEADFDRHFLGTDDFEDTEKERQNGTYHIYAYAAKNYIRKLLAAQETAFKERVREGICKDVVGEIGAKLLARQSPQIVLDAYFDAANEVLEAYGNDNENDN